MIKIGKRASIALLLHGTVLALLVNCGGKDGGSDDESTGAEFKQVVYKSIKGRDRNRAIVILSGKELEFREDREVWEGTYTEEGDEVRAVFLREGKEVPVTFRRFEHGLRGNGGTYYLAEKLDEFVERKGDKDRAREIVHLLRDRQETPRLVEVLQDHLAEGAAVWHRTEVEETALHLAVHCRNQAAVELLLKADAPLEARTAKGDTPVHYAVGLQNLRVNWSKDESAARTAQILKALIGAGANINASNNAGTTPLMIALQRFDNQTARILVHAGADQRVQDKSGKSAADYALDDGQKAVLRDD